MEPGGANRAKPEFEAILNESIEEGLRYVLGESGLRMVLSDHPIDRLSADPAAFHEILKDIFMENGAAIIEREIARRLLEKAGDKQKGVGRCRQSWLASAASHNKASRRVSQREKEVLRGFVALASLPTVSPVRERTDAVAWRGERGSIELTALEFAYAFRKGS